MIITGRVPGEQPCWSERWTGFSARTVAAVITTALIAGLLVALGATAIPAAVEPAVVPLFFDIQRVT